MAGPTAVVIDTMDLTAILDTRATSFGAVYRQPIGAAPTVVSFVTMT